MIRKSVEECWSWHWEFRFRKYTFRQRKPWHIIQNIMGFVWMFMLQFLDYVKNTGRTEEISTTDPFVRHLQDSIDKIKQNRRMEERYMLLEEMMRNERQEGKIEGKLEGNTEGNQEFLLAALESKFSVPSELKEKIMSETDIEKLNLWFQLSLKVSSLEAFEQNM